MQDDFLRDFDFSLLDTPDFKEDSVREELIHPILKALGYKASGKNKIVRSKSLAHPIVKVGSQKRKIKSVPDYLLEVDGDFVWVLDAKEPGQNIQSGEHVEQVYFYAIHPDIRVKYYVLCNGREWIVNQIDQNEAILYFHLSEINHHWQELVKLLSPKNLKSVKAKSEDKESKRDFDYLNRPLLKEIPVRKRAAKRHFGVHGYFTKQTWNVVLEYIKNFTQPGDLVLDPYGGSGVTAIEALMLNRRAINIDLNPLAVFLVDALVAPVKQNDLREAFDRIISGYKRNEPKNSEEIKKAINKYPKPKDLTLP